jgi:hypothetical protein
MVLTCYSNYTVERYMPLCILPTAKQKCLQNGQTELDVGAAQLPAVVKQKTFRNVIEMLHSHTILRQRNFNTQNKSHKADCY